MLRRRSRVVHAIVLLLALAGESAGQPHLVERNILTSRYDLETVYDVLVGHGDWRPLPDIEARDAWDAVPTRVREAHIAAAERLLGTPWESMPATVFLEFDRTGDRTNFQRITFSRRERLATMVIAELMDNRRRFMDDIVDGIWMISEETFWGIPAHLDLQTAGFGLPDVNEPAVDLFAAETGALLSWTLYLLGPRLDEISPLITERIRTEVRRRILEPTRNRDDFWWMGFDPTVINNWTPWIGSNWLASLLLVETDPHERAFGVHKVMRTLDTFLNSYPDDGGCDEGPGYWNRAGGSLLDALEILASSSEERISVYDEPLVQEMGRFMYRTHVGGPYFINFADAGPRVVPDADVMFRYGNRIGDQRLQAFAAYVSRQNGLGDGFIEARFGSIFRQIRTILTVKELGSVEPLQPLLGDVWLPDTEIMAARMMEGSLSGLYLAAKAGHNGENHNHNDVGNFIVYESGRPALIDVGPGTYTRTTFSSDRYTVWNFQSAYHNVPTINGVMQKEGAAFGAGEVVYESSPYRSRIQMDLAGAYPGNAAVKTWVRTIELDRETKTVTMSDNYALSGFMQPPQSNLMTPLKVQADDSGIIRLSQAGLDDVLILFDPEVMTAVVESIELEDDRLRGEWGSRLNRIVLTARGKQMTGLLTVTIRSESPGPSAGE